MSQSVAVLEKAFQVLETLNRLDRPVSLQLLCEEAALPKPTLHRILQTLLELGYVDQDRARARYALTPRLFHLGRKQEYSTLIDDVLPVMQALHARFDETVNLGVLRGGFVYYLHFIETTHKLKWQVRPGARDPYYSTALGRAIVSRLPVERRDQLLSRTELVPITDRTPASIDALRSEIERTAERGWAHDDEENDLGVACFGVALMAAGGTPVAALSLSVPKGRLTPAREADIVDALCAAGRDLNFNPERELESLTA